MNFNINDGHTLSGYDGGAVANGIREQDLTRMVGNLVRIKLKSKGHVVTNCSVDSATSVSSALNAISSKSNAVKCDLFISIHFNASNGLGHGTEVYTYGAKPLTQAKDILNNIVKLGFNNRGIKDGRHLAVIKNTHAPAMLIECCFIDNKSDMKLLNIEKLSDAIVNGLVGAAVVKDSCTTERTKYIVSEYQKFYNKLTQTGSPLTVDGLYGDKTQKAIDTMTKLIKGEYK